MKRTDTQQTKENPQVNASFGLLHILHITTLHRSLSSNLLKVTFIPLKIGTTTYLSLPVLLKLMSNELKLLLYVNLVFHLAN